jgi:EAL domain-containing protein (putative c-di-GMP-specific phosphodiesterase class I)
VLPSEFIPVAEEVGLIVPIGEWVLEHACQEAAKWPEAIGLAINVSVVQFRNPHLVEVVEQALRASGLAADRLSLEITESVLMQNTQTTLATLKKLRELGIRISMDDFGTGYSSLSYLRSFPFDKIKIDKCFVKDLGSSESSIAIIRAVVHLGRALGMPVTAEGVETAEQFARIKAEGCSEGQGFLFSRPCPADAVASTIAQLNHSLALTSTRSRMFDPAI